MQNDNSKLKINDKKDHEEKRSEEKKEDKEIEELKKKVEELENNWKRAVADYQNLEKRVVEEKGEWAIIANKNLLLRILPVLDTLILAERHGKAHDEGLSLSIKQLQDILKSEAVERIEALGKSFDPKLMECIETIDGEEDKVLEEVRTGYALHGNVLRPALVKVGKRS